MQLERRAVDRDAEVESAALYLDLLKRYLTRSGSRTTWRPLQPHRDAWYYPAAASLQSALTRRGFALCRAVTADAYGRVEADDFWPADAETMVGMTLLDHLQDCIADVLRRDVPGDLIETGVWRGGSTIFMRGALKAYGDVDRIVWAADSFEGLPKPDARYGADADTDFWAITSMAVPLEEVKQNFARYGLLDEQVRFLRGWFRDTLPTAPIERLAVLRLDGVMYESTMDALRALYPKVSPGGYVILDDYAVPASRTAVTDYRAEHGITDPIEMIDRRSAFWRREGGPAIQPSGRIAAGVDQRGARKAST